MEKTFGDVKQKYLDILKMFPPNRIYSKTIKKILKHRKLENHRNHLKIF